MNPKDTFLDNDNKDPNGNTAPAPYKCGVTPDCITDLGDKEVFVFGSNLQGRHSGGAARVAHRLFGAVLGQGVGLQGSSYAIPTMQGPAYTISPYVDDFIKFAKENPDKHFLVTKIGCGIAGFKPEDIAPLFRGAIGVSNISLPKEFIDYILAHPILPSYVVKKVHGQTRTLVDILCELNKEHHFRSAKDALHEVYSFIRSKQTGPDGTAWNFSMRSLAAFTEKCMTPEGLDIQHLYLLMEGLLKDHYHGIEEIYRQYVIEKTIKIVELLNEFRRYTDPNKLLDDLMEIGVGANHCGPQREDFYYMFGSPAGAYVFGFLDKYTIEFWNEFAPKGTLDNELYKEFMYRRHARGLDKYGLDAVIERNYKSDAPCHTEVYFPYRGGAGPVYMEQILYAEDRRRTEVRKMVKSCGEGKGPNGIEDLFEFRRMRPLLEKDPKYVLVDKQGPYFYLFVPKNDVTLPLYSFHMGKIRFVSEEDKQKTITNIWAANPELFPCHN